MPNLDPELVLKRCPHCNIADPHLHMRHNFDTHDHASKNARAWGIYQCASCGGIISAWSNKQSPLVREMFPSGQIVNENIPDRARAYLSQSIECKHAPSASIMAAAAAVDAMLKEKGLVDGTLNTRINEAASNNLITAPMAQWAHNIRLDANDQRHADQAVPLPNSSDAQKCIDFALAFAEYLFVLPGRVDRGLTQATDNAG